MDILRLFFDCDEFCRVFEPPLRALLLSDGKRHRQRESTLSTSEVMTIVILFQSSGFRNFKTYYTQRGLRASAERIPKLGQLSTVRRTAKRDRLTADSFLAYALWALHWHLLH